MTECFTEGCTGKPEWYVFFHGDKITKEEAMEIQEDEGFPVHIHGFVWHKNQGKGSAWSCRIEPNEL